jgi:hypothetical protein
MPDERQEGELLDDFLRGEGAIRPRENGKHGNGQQIGQLASVTMEAAGG